MLVLFENWSAVVVGLLATWPTGDMGAVAAMNLH